MEIFASAKLDIILAVVLFLIPLGIALMGYSVNVPMGAICWLFSLLLLLHGFWVWHGTSRIPVPIKLGIVLTLFIWGAIGIYYAAIIADRRERAKSTTGELVPTGTLPKCQSGMYGMQIGNDGVLCIDPHKAKGFINALGDALTLKEIDGTPRLSAVVRDYNGEIIVEIKNNVWTIPQDKIWDKNYTKNRIEVIDRRGLVVLSLELLKNGIRLEADWHNEYREDIRIWQMPSGAGEVKVFGAGAVIPRNEIKRVFKYPSTKYLGELDSGSGS